MKITKDISLLVEPHRKLTYEMVTQTEVDIVPSSKKIRILESEPKMNNYGEA